MVRIEMICRSFNHFSQEHATGFVPLRYQPENNDIPVKAPPTGFDALHTLAVSRIYLDNWSAGRAICQPMPPIARLPLPVRDGDDEEVVGFDGVEHRVRKHAHEAAPHIFLLHSPPFRRSGNFPNGCPNLVGKPPAKIKPAFLVEAHGLLEFQGRFGMELVPHLASRRSMRR